MKTCAQCGNPHTSSGCLCISCYTWTVLSVTSDELPTDPIYSATVAQWVGEVSGVLDSVLGGE